MFDVRGRAGCLVDQVSHFTVAINETTIRIQGENDMGQAKLFLVDNVTVTSAQ